MTKAFSGIRIIDFSQVLAGPFCTQQMAQLGAEVIKVEPRETGDMTRGTLIDKNTSGMPASFVTCNLGKRSITLDLKNPSSKLIIEKLIASAHAVVENFKPGVMARLGLDYDYFKSIKPDIIYLSISGYGQSGPKAPLAAFDGAIQAASGMMSITGHPETGPTRTGYFPVDMATALNAAFALSAALYRWQSTGEGQRVDVAMMDTAMVLQAAQMTRYFMDDEVPELFGNRSPTKQPTANVFASADGFIQVIALKEAQAAKLFEALGETERYATPPFDSARSRLKAIPEVNKFLVEIFAAKPSAYWLALLSEYGVPVAEVRDLPNVVTDEQFDSRQSLVEVVPPQGVPHKVVSAGHIASPDGPNVPDYAPRLGEHTEDILGQLGFTDRQVQQFQNDAVV